MSLKLDSFHFVLLPIALGLVVPTLLMPWAIINFQGVSGLTPIDLIKGSLGNTDNSFTREHPELVFLNLVSTSKMQAGFVLWAISYLASIIAILLSVGIQRWRTKFSLAAGVLVILSASTWLITIEQIKVSFAEQAALTGGLIGEEFKGSERTLIDTILKVGFGPFVALSAGAPCVLFYVWASYLKSNNKTTPNLQGK
jgi:hypothetical protein